MFVPRGHKKFYVLKMNAKSTKIFLKIIYELEKGWKNILLASKQSPAEMSSLQ